jgi:hypothetical protein
MKDGGSAFPVMETYVSPQTGEQRLECMSYGMSLRDYFAGQALAGIFSTTDLFIDDKIATVYAEQCYTIAAAMIAHREAKKAEEAKQA